MRAVVRERYGSPDVIELRDVERPVPGDDEVLVRVRAASLNRADWYSLNGRPYVARPTEGLRSPKSERLGVDYAGTVETVGKDVTSFRPGDEVFGGRDGALADYVCVREERAIVPKPPNVSFEQAAAVGVAGLTALQGLRDKGGLQPGQNVLVNGASGGVGTFAVQVAKALGAEVTAVCSSGNVEQARSLGADDVVDYTAEDFTRSGRRYDLVFDVAGSRSWSQLKRVLEPEATVVLVGGSMSNRWLGPLGHVVTDEPGLAAREPEDRLLHREVQQARPRGPARDARGRPADSHRGAAVPAGRRRRGVPLHGRRTRAQGRWC